MEQNSQRGRLHFFEQVYLYFVRIKRSSNSTFDQSRISTKIHIFCLLYTARNKLLDLLY